jgi:hypothetical protein
MCACNVSRANKKYYVCVCVDNHLIFQFQIQFLATTPSSSSSSSLTSTLNDDNNNNNSSSSSSNGTIFVIDDGSQPKIELSSKDRNLIAATFTHFLIKNIGGSETFKDKQDFFYHEVRKFHGSNCFHEKISLKVQREKILESSMKATKNFSGEHGEWKLLAPLFYAQFVLSFSLISSHSSPRILQCQIGAETLKLRFRASRLVTHRAHTSKKQQEELFITCTRF